MPPAGSSAAKGRKMPAPKRMMTSPMKAGMSSRPMRKVKVGKK